MSEGLWVTHGPCFCLCLGTITMSCLTVSPCGASARPSTSSRRVRGLAVRARLAASDTAPVMLRDHAGTRVAGIPHIKCLLWHSTEMT